MSCQIGAIDVGFDNLGFAIAEVGNCDGPWDDLRITFFKKISLGDLRHDRTPRENCHLHHTAHIVDVIEHFIQEYGEQIMSLKTLIIEQQPPMGMKDIEALLYRQYRDRAIVVSPRSMHSHFHMGKANYEQRKEIVEGIAERTLESNPKLLEKYKRWKELDIRRHDVGDAISYIQMHVDLKKEEWKLEQSRKRPVAPEGKTIDWEKYKYRPQKIQKQ